LPDAAPGRVPDTEETPMRFAMLINQAPDAGNTAPSSEREAMMEEIFAWMEKWGAAGKIADGGAELDHPRTARTARSGPDGQPVITDGPYLELKEVIGGIMFLEAPDIDEAIAIAATWPPLREPSHSVEVRPVLEH
jgi:hypothetical protein